MFGNKIFKMIENKNWRKEIKLNAKQKRITDEYIHQYF